MAETDLKITVTVPGITTLDDARKALKQLNKELGLTAIDNIPRQKALGAEIVKVKSIIADATSATQTANAKMMKSYFQTGEELRRFYREQRLGDRTMREATATIGGLGSMLGGEGIGKIVGQATSRFQEMEFAVNGIGIAAQGGSAKMASLGQKLIAMAGPIALAAAAFGLISMGVKELDENQARLKKSLQEYIDLLHELGKLSDKDYLKKLKEGIDEAEKAVQKAKKEGGLSFLGKVGAIWEGIISGNPDKADLREQEAWEASVTEKKVEKAKAEKKYADELKKSTEALEKQKKAEDDLWAAGWQQRQKYGEWFTQKSLEAEANFIKTGRQSVQFPSMISPGTGATRAKGSAVSGAEKPINFVDTFAPNVGKSEIIAKQFTDGLGDGFRQATSYLAEGFVNAFNLGDSLAGRFAGTMMSSMAQVVANITAQWISAQIVGQGVQAASAAAMAATTAATMGSIAAAATPAATLVSIATMGGAAAAGGAAVIAALVASQAASTAFSVAGLATAGAVKHATGDYWFTEPTYAVGMKSGKRHLIAENGPEYLSTMNQAGQAGRYGGGGNSASDIANALQAIEWRIKGLDIVASYNKNKSIRLARNW